MNKKRKVYAFFDFDGTIVSRDTFLDIFRFYTGSPRCYLFFVRYLPQFVLYCFGAYPLRKMKGLLVSYFFGGMTRKEFTAVCGAYADGVIPGIVKSEAMKRIVWHQRRGDILVIVSASLESWIIPWAEKNGFESVIATKPKFEQGKIIGDFMTKNCIGSEKVRRICESYPDACEADVFAYGDSAGDAEMLAFATHAYYRRFS